MKKYIGLIILSLFLLTGCGERKVTCTYTSNENFSNVTSKVTILYDKYDVIKKVERKTSRELNDKDFLEEFKDTKTDTKVLYKELKKNLNNNYFKGKLKTSKNKITLIESYKFYKMTEDDFENAGLSRFYDEDAGVIYLDEFKGYLKRANYKCVN